MKWLKDANKKWALSTNEISYSDFQENLKPTSALNITKSSTGKTVVYLPTHNVHDVHEWYRMFRDSYLYTTSFDAKGHAIHAYFSKDRGESIKGWFPNLVEVKASSSSELQYYSVGAAYHRSSVDRISDFTELTELSMDGVQVFDEELVLLMHQYYDVAVEHVISTVNSSGSSYYVAYTAGDEAYFAPGNQCVIKNTANVYHSGTILTTGTTTVGLTTYLLITVDIEVENPDTIIDVINGAWVKNSAENMNGVYQYIGGDLVAIPEMSDKYKTYSQIVFTYQGITNQNKEFYLRKCEIQGSSYGQYPTIGGPLAMLYSEGDAYLIKCEMDYNLDIAEPLHPVVSGPYGPAEDVYRMLFLDRTMTDKVMTVNENGISSYKLLDNVFADIANIPLGTGYTFEDGTLDLDDITFLDSGRYGITNVLNKHNRDRYHLSPVMPNYTFISTPLSATFYLSLWFTNDLVPTGDMFYHENSEITIVQNDNTSSVYGSYINGGRMLPGSFHNGDFINLTFTFYDAITDKTWVALDEQFVIVSWIWTTSGPTLEIYPKLDDAFVNQFQTYVTTATYNNPPTNTVTLHMDQVNSYGKFEEDYLLLEDSAQLLLEAIHKTILTEVYDFSYSIKMDFTYLEFNGKRQGHPYMWENHGMEITTTSNTFYIDSTVDPLYRQYFKGSDILSYLQDYLNCFPTVSVSLAQMQDVTAPYKNSLNATDRFGVEGSNKVTGRGNLILFGEDYKETILDNIKPDTLVNFNPTAGSDTLVWVSRVTWDDDKNLGTITTLNDIFIPSTGVSVTLEIVRDMPSIVAALDVILNKEVNQTNNADAFDELNKRVTHLDAASTANVNILSAPASIDGYTLMVGDTVMLKNQVTVLQNRIYYFNGVGNPLVRYDVSSTPVVVSATGNQNIAIAPASIDGVTLVAGDLVSLMNQTAPNQNRVYVFNTVGNPLIIYQNFTENIAYKYFIDNGVTNIDNVYTASFDQPLTPADVVTFTLGSLSSAVVPFAHKTFNPDTASYAYALLNYGYNNSTTVVNTKLLDHLTGIVYKEFGEPRVSFLKRDKTFAFGNGTVVAVVAASTANVNISSAPATIDGVALAPGNLVLLKNQTLPQQNGIYIFVAAALALTDNGYIYASTHYQAGPLGTVNADKMYQAQYALPLVRLTTPVTFTENEFIAKFDPRLTLKPIEIAKLGVDNKTQPWKKINMKYDSLEETENVLDIQIGINNRHRIRFIDGLTEDNIIGDILGQGQYAWILDEDVIVDNAVVGCTQDSGPGTGTLIWYTGTWEQGIWVNGIWMQGTWTEGTWLNGTWNSYEIQDYYYYVTYTEIQNDIMSTWVIGTWTDGTWNGGVAESMVWLAGTFNGGIIQDGTWATGTFTGGTMQHIVWTSGTFNGGDFETGLWLDGLFQELDPTVPARFGTAANGASTAFADRAIWRQGIFDGGEFWSGVNYVGGQYVPSVDHRGSVWYSGEFRTGDWYGGSFVTGVFKNSTWHGGVWFGGYYATVANLTGSNKRFTIDPNQYDVVLGLSTTTGYMPNGFHRMHTYYQTAFQLIGIPSPDTAFGYDAFINKWDEQFSVPYVDKIYVAGSATYNTIDLTVSASTAATTIYQAANTSTHDVDGRPFLCAVFKTATWKNGVFINGYFHQSIWECGAFVNGYMNDSTFGINGF